MVSARACARGPRAVPLTGPPRLPRAPRPAVRPVLGEAGESPCERSARTPEHFLPPAAAAAGRTGPGARRYAQLGAAARVAAALPQTPRRRPRALPQCPPPARSPSSRSAPARPRWPRGPGPGEAPRAEPHPRPTDRGPRAARFGQTPALGVSLPPRLSGHSFPLAPLASPPPPATRWTEPIPWGVPRPGRVWLRARAGGTHPSLPRRGPRPSAGLRTSWVSHLSFRVLWAPPRVSPLLSTRRVDPDLGREDVGLPPACGEPGRGLSCAGRGSHLPPAAGSLREEVLQPRPALQEARGELRACCCTSWPGHCPQPFPVWDS